MLVAWLNAGKLTVVVVALLKIIDVTEVNEGKDAVTIDEPKKEKMFNTCERFVSVIDVRFGLFDKSKFPNTVFNAGNETEVSKASPEAVKKPKALTKVGKEIAATLGDV